MTRLRALAVAAVAVLLASAGACGSDATPSTPSSGSTGDRAFGADRATVEEALKAALNADRVEFDGNHVLVHLPSGSIDDPTAGLYCSSIDALVADDELGFFVYPDGVYDCRDRA